MDFKPPIVPNRSCDGCALCCKLVGIKEIAKPQAEWCPHCVKHSRCAIYESRPGECGEFHCEWLIKPQVGDVWRPTHSKMVLVMVEDGGRLKLVVHVDPGSPMAWRKEPYYSQLKTWSQNLLDRGGTVNVYIRNRVHVVFPDKDVDLGIFGDGDAVVVSARKVGSAWQTEATKATQPAGSPQ
ncbi:MAG TPA: hypothetical protein VGC36_01915 [Rhizomicrobium sp.]